MSVLDASRSDGVSPRERRRPRLLVGAPRSTPNILRVVGFNAPDPVIVLDQGGGRRTLWVPAMETERAQREAHGAAVHSLAERLLTSRSAELSAQWPRVQRLSCTILAICERYGAESIDVDAGFPASLADDLRSLGLEVHPRVALYRDERRIKTAPERDGIRDVQEASMRALAEAIRLIGSTTPDASGVLRFEDGRPARSADVIRLIERYLADEGFTAEDTIAVGGPDGQSPHARESRAPLQAGTPIVIDVFPWSKTTRLWGDVTRTVVRGTPRPEVARMLDAVTDAKVAALAMLRPGVPTSLIHRSVCETFARWGYGSSTSPFDRIDSPTRFTHSTGHGVGYEIHEFPRVGGAAPGRPSEILRIDEAVAIEPGVYGPEGGVRDEDLLFITATGYVNAARNALPRNIVLPD